MKIYNVLKSNNYKFNDPIFLSDEFNFKAFIFCFFWTIYNKMWKVTFIILSFNIFVSTLNTYGIISSFIYTILSLLPNIILGIYANEMLYSDLIKKNYVIDTVICENSITLAKRRYFDNYSII